ncbi:MAG: cytochrome c oxidase subunit 3 [Akkermansiaceae bacterium]|nr:cytochrome c oxidase subunit 3 [Akkermansiaceae bacterium]
MSAQATTSIDPKSIWYPPGGLLIWSLVLMELFTFGVALIAFMVSAQNDPGVFHASRLLLNPLYGVINTVFLLTSGYFMACSVEQVKRGDMQRAHRLLLFTMLGGLLFLVLKAVEYHGKIQDGLVLGYDTFFTFYWLLTCFHVMHVLVGLVILASMAFRLKNPNKTIAAEDYEAGGVFWHMCDLIWLLLFPVIYLLV